MNKLYSIKLPTIKARYHEYGDMTGSGSFTLINPTITVLCSKYGGYRFLIDKPWPHTNHGNAHTLCLGSYESELTQFINNKLLVKEILITYFSFIKYDYAPMKLSASINDTLTSNDFFICKIDQKIYNKQKESHVKNVSIDNAKNIPPTASTFQSLKRCHYCGIYNFRFQKDCIKCKHVFPK